MLGVGAYLAGVALLAAIVAALAFGAARLRATLLPTWSGAPARLAEAILALAGFLAISQVLGLLGVFQKLPLLILTVAAGAAIGLLGPQLLQRPLPGVAPERHPALGGYHLQLGIALAATLIALAHWTLPTLEALDQGIYGFDSQWYHLPFAARFAETGGIWAFHYTSPVLLSWFYPASSELLHGAGIVVFDRDLLSPVMNLGWLLLALLAAWCLGRPWGVGGLSVLGAFVVFDAGVFADQAGGARNDAMAAALLLSAGALLAQRPLSPGLGGLAAGAALGTRLTSLAPVVALTAGVAWLAGRRARLRMIGIWIAAVALTGGLWYLRNAVATGSPLPQLRSVGPIGLPGPDQALGGRPSFSVAHYATDLTVWAEWFAPALRDALGLLWPLLLALAAAGALLALLRGPSPAIRMLGAVAVITAAAYLITPVTASGPEGEPIGFGPNLRYLAPALALALALLPVALRVRGGRPLVIGTLALGVVAVAVAAEPARWHGGGARAAAAICVLALLVLGVVALRATRPGFRPALALAVTALIGLVVVGGYFEQRRYLDQRYADPAAFIETPGLDAVFVWAREVRDARIATTATRQYPLYGTDLSNHVQFIGDERANAGFTRPTSCRRWRHAVDRGDYDYVVTALDRLEPGTPDVPPERVWTARSPNAREILRDGPASVFELTGPLDPSRCP